MINGERQGSDCALAQPHYLGNYTTHDPAVWAHLPWLSRAAAPTTTDVKVTRAISMHFPCCWQYQRVDVMVLIGGMEVGAEGV